MLSFYVLILLPQDLSKLNLRYSKGQGLSKKKSILSLLLKYKYSFILGIISLSLVDLAQLVIPRIIQTAIDTLTKESVSIKSISRYGIYILGLGLFMAIFRLGWRYFIMGAARKIENSLRNEFFEHLQSLNYDFFSTRKVGDLMAHTVNDIETLKYACGLGILIAYDGIFLFFFIFVAMILISPELTLYAFIPFPILGLLMYLLGNKIEKRFQATQDAFSDLTESARQAISGIKVIKSFNREGRESKDFEQVSANYLSKNIRLIKVWGIHQPLITFLTGAAAAIFLLVGGTETIKGDISVGKFSAMLIYLAMLSWPMMAMGWSIDILKRGKASINRLNKIFEIKPPEENTTSSKMSRNIYGDISIKNLSFAYNGKPVLKNINLHIPKDSTLGITGSTGAGKTTLLTLLMKIHPVKEGSIFINDIDINSITRKEIQKNFIFVPQETTIFSGTIRDNITFMNPDISIQDVERATKLSAIYDEIINLPEGFDTYVGERGLSLSGGQRQRIAIARAILFNPKVLILDDVLSSLDPQTERIVFNNIKKIMEGKTLIVVSSRVPLISTLHQIVVMEEGKIVERGKHEELIEKEGIYSTMYKVQTMSNFEGENIAGQRV